MGPIDKDILSSINEFLWGYSVIIRSVCKLWKNNFTEKKSDLRLLMRKEPIREWILSNFSQTELRYVILKADIDEHTHYLIPELRGEEIYKYDCPKIFTEHMESFPYFESDNRSYYLHMAGECLKAEVIYYYDQLDQELKDMVKKDLVAVPFGPKDLAVIFNLCITYELSNCMRYYCNNFPERFTISIIMMCSICSTKMLRIIFECGIGDGFLKSMHSLKIKVSSRIVSVIDTIRRKNPKSAEFLESIRVD